MTRYIENDNGEFVEEKNSKPHHGHGRRRRYNRPCMEKRTRPQKKGHSSKA